MGRSRIAVAGIVLALAVAAYGAWWLHAASRLREGVAQWTEARRAEGWQVTLGDVVVQGFPLCLQVVAQSFSIGRDAPLAWRWTGPRFSASAPPWIGRVLDISSPGMHRLELDAPGGPKVVALDAAKTEGTVRVAADSKIERIEFDLEKVTATTPDLVEVKIAQLLFAVAGPAKKENEAASESSPRAPEVGRLALIAVDVELPPSVAPALGPRIGRAEAELLLRGGVPAARTRAALDLWRDAGGTLELSKLRLHWGEFQVEAQGTAALDSELQPIGALTTRMWGVGAAIDALVAAGSVRPREGATAKVVLRGMAKPGGPPGVAPDIQAPLAVQDGKLYLGPVAIARIPRIDWP